MHVLMRVNVGWIAAHQLPERVELKSSLFKNCQGVIFVCHPIELGPFAIMPAGPFSQIEMKTDTQYGMRASVFAGLPGRRPSNHEAGAGDDTLLVRPDNAAIDAWTAAEVIGVHNQKLFVILRAWHVIPLPSLCAANQAAPLFHQLG